MEFKPAFPCKVLVCGDSISAGIVYDEASNRYVKSKDSFVNQLQTSLNCVVTNISRFGNTIVTALPKLTKGIARETPDIVLIELGGNDCDYEWDKIAENPAGDHQPATDIALFETDLSDMVGSLRSYGVAPVLMSLPPIDADKYFKWISHSSFEAGAKIMEWLGSVTKIYWWQEKYNAAVLTVAEKTNTAWIDLRSAFLNTPDFRRYLCKDGIHPNQEGHALIGLTISNYLKVYCPSLLKPATV
jgi:lysophospholipase L1-like esterase